MAIWKEGFSVGVKKKYIYKASIFRLGISDSINLCQVLKNRKYRLQILWWWSMSTGGGTDHCYKALQQQLYCTV